MIDLHCHSLFSDGTDSPETLAHLADEADLRALALTDHDTVAGLPRFLAAQPGTRARLVPGIELSCRFLGSELHVIGLFVDPQDVRFLARVEDLRLRRADRNRRMLERLASIGIPLVWGEVRALASTDLVSRAHFAKALVNRGDASSREDAFQRIIGDGCPGYAPFNELRPEEAATWIREAGGVALVAHPGRFGGRSFRWDEAMRDLKARGLQGFEAHYASYSPAEEAHFLALAQRMDMAVSGGSDYHGAYKPGIRLGAGRGNLNVPDECLAALEALAAASPSRALPLG